ncbi:MAG: GGDEF domain-containing protein [Rugosibacter sp.]|nr:GGDEF domain-containing protein [Rugosibacter sp.]
MISPKVITHWWQGILARSIAGVLVMALFVGGVSSYLIRQSLSDREQEQAIRRLTEALETVQSTASIAAFTHDAQLAGEVVEGLMRTSDILTVKIETDGKILAQDMRSLNAPPVNTRLTSDMGIAVHQSSLSKPLVSPFNKTETIGYIILQPDWLMIESRVRQNVQQTLGLLIAEMIAVLLSVAAVMLFFVLRPIKEISDRLHHAAPETGAQIDIPEGHEKTEIGRLVGDVNSITNRLVMLLAHEREIQKQREIAQKKYQNLFDHATSGIFVADKTGRLDSFNPAFSELVWHAYVSQDKDPNLFDAAWQAPEKIKSLFVLALRQETAGRVSTDDFLLRGRRGDERWLSISLTSLGDGSLQGTVTDVTARKQEEMQARRLAGMDALTGLANRQGLMEVLSRRTVGDVKRRPFAVLMINLDGFGQINESMGLPVGDDVLKVVAERIRAFIQGDDYSARIGGDEFVLVLEDKFACDAFDHQLRDFFAVLQQPYRMAVPDAVRVISIQASAGVAFYAADSAQGVDAHELLRHAELALMTARSAGGHTYRFFEPQLLVAAEHRRRIEDDLKQALEDGSLYLGFQPIVDLTSGTVVGAESLIRWIHPTRGMVPPDIFIPLAEEVGLISEIGLLVLEKACQVVSQWRAKAQPLYVSINVSALQIPNALPPATIISALARHGLPPDALAIEITEGVLMGNVSVAQTWMTQLGEAGLRVYLDDFGTGYSSLSYLKRFPLNAVKIDKSFIHDLAEDSNDKALVNAIVTMAKSLSLDVIAEGVESAEHLRILREMGCRLGQGFLFSPAVQAHLFEETVKDIEQRLAAMPVPW